MEEFIKHLEENSILITRQVRKNKWILEDVEAELSITGNILAPSTALDLAELFEDYINILVALDYFPVKFNILRQYELKELITDELILIKNIARLDSYSNGNLTSFLNFVIDKVPVNVRNINIKRNMINYKINSIKTEEGVKLKC